MPNHVKKSGSRIHHGDFTGDPGIEHIHWMTAVSAGSGVNIMDAVTHFKISADSVGNISIGKKIHISYPGSPFLMAGMGPRLAIVHGEDDPSTDNFTNCHRTNDCLSSKHNVDGLTDTTSLYDVLVDIINRSFAMDEEPYSPSWTHKLDRDKPNDR